MTDSAIGGSPKPEGLQDYVVRYLSRSILSGASKPGDRLSPGRLADDLGVSHIPVREALAALQAVGHVEHVPRIGFFVAELSLTDLLDLFHWMRVLEDEANEIAVGRLDDDDFRRMRQLVDQMAGAVKHGDQARFGELDRDLHFTAYERVGSARLLRFLTPLWDSAIRYRSGLAHARLPLNALHEQHGELIGAYEDRDPGRVNRLLARHRDLSLTALRSALTGQDAGQEDPTAART